MKEVLDFEDSSGRTCLHAAIDNCHWYETTLEPGTLLLAVIVC
jgi:hypothetical protein